MPQELNSLKNILSSKEFIIPRNQRGYAWEAEQLNDLFSDIDLLIEESNNDNHYFGIILTTNHQNIEIAEDDHLNQLFLDDGQQRLTTLMLMGKLILDRYEFFNGAQTENYRDLRSAIFYKPNGWTDQNPRYAPRLSNQDVHFNEQLRHLFLDETPPSYTLPSMKRLFSAQEELKLYVEKKSSDLNELHKLYQLVFKRLKLVRVDLLDEKVNRFLTFDSVNSRGLPLSEFDKIKNFSILVLEDQRQAADEDTVANAWHQALKNFDVPGVVASRSSEQTFIQSLYNTCYKISIPKEQVYSHLHERYKKLLSKPNDKEETELLKFVQCWDEYSEHFLFIDSPERDLINFKDQRKVVSSKAKKLLKCIDRTNYSSMIRTLLTAALIKFEKQQFENFVKACEIFIFRVHCVPKGSKANANDKKLITMAHEIYIDGKSYDYAMEELSSLLNDQRPLQDFVNQLADGSARYEQKGVSSRWARLYYFLHAQDVIVSSAPMEYPPQERDQEGQIEHILPQSFANLTESPKEWCPPWDLEMGNKFLNRLGNLVLTKNGDSNRKLSNYEFSTKSNGRRSDGRDRLTYYYNHTQATSGEKDIKDYLEVENQETWHAKEILRREFMIIRRAIMRWKLDTEDCSGLILPDQFFSGVNDETKVVLQEDCSINSAELAKILSI
jgi:uncharacterized protein with ParB-like and HNH nuclease domain